jgi:hypothetical protein
MDKGGLQAVNTSALRTSLHRAWFSLGVVVWLTLCGVLASCGDECSSYSSFSCKQIEAADYNVYFYFPSGTEQYLGEAKGLSQCGQRAHGFAASKNLRKAAPATRSTANAPGQHNGCFRSGALAYIAGGGGRGPGKPGPLALGSPQAPTSQTAIFRWWLG